MLIYVVKKKKFNTIIFLIILFFSSCTYAYKTVIRNTPKKQTKTEEPPKIGNYALPVAQQPGPLISFGQNNLEKHQSQLFLFANDFVGVKKHLVSVIPAYLYGLTDNLSFFFVVPVAADFKADQYHSYGFQDLAFQAEYIFFSKSTKTYADQASLVTTVTLPTGSKNKIPNTGSGAPTFFVGFTLDRMYTDWYLFTSHGALFTTAQNGTKFGNEYFYQAGIGRNIFSIPNKLIFDWLIEVDGYYDQKDRVAGTIDPDSGGNIIYVTPSLWISTKHFLFQGGVGVPVSQHLFGNQKREKYLAAANMAWTFG